MEASGMPLPVEPAAERFLRASVRVASRTVATQKKRKAELSAEDIERLAERIVEETEREGIVALSKLTSLGVDKHAKAAVLDALGKHAHVEVTKRAVRLPVRAQLASRLDAGAALAMKTIASAAAGATKKEITDAIDELVDAGDARLIVRGAEIAVVGRSLAALDDAALDRLDRALAELSKTIKLARKKKGTVLEADVASVLAPLVRATVNPTKANGETTQPASGGSKPSVDDVLVFVERHREATSGLTFVPTLVRALGHDRDAVHAALLRAANAGMLELRPESGMGRLSAEDQMLCLPGPQGSRLSWVRRIDHEASS
jgi:hypothetical protein